MKISFSPASLPKSGVLILLVTEGQALSGLAAEADRRTGGQIRRAMTAAGFTGRRDSTLDIVAPGGSFSRAVLFGLGQPAALRPLDLELLGGAAAGISQALKTDVMTIAADLAAGGLPPGETAALIASGIKLRVYSFNHYKSKKPEAKELREVTILTPDAKGARQRFAPLEAVADGVHLARDLVNEPPNHLHPVAFASRMKPLAKLGLKISVMSPAQMKKLGMNALLGVAQGSAHEARMVVMEWKGGKANEAPLAFIGKGVTFDTGGISIKPAAGMEDMKGDMGGAACVAGLMMALAKRKARVNVVGAIGLVENMPDGKAQRPGDVVTSMSGQTIAVLNTDAEGRLVLADVLWYVQDRFKPRFMIDLATLTGAILVALGKEHAGLFSNSDELAQRLSEVGYATGEKVWRMPLAPEYDKIIDHDVADVKNTGGRHAGSITAAQFLQRFVNNVPWAHLDVAGTAMDGPRSSINQSWGPGWGVRLLDRLVNRFYEG
ncbi:MAG: leucyl aminopeptidase [Aestuariivirga sp.]|uniref:leucyl aminopeptidase n=1 Tax=Aestuariivirga sp. TaxID=2650926 RepID=UPI0025BF5697|nr:leucyl aminopeptidase [Aestuariivirga sp.]MCA3561632.1 leucyl aminopeptidase [Aestuariivirga sp.]